MLFLLLLAWAVTFSCVNNVIMFGVELTTCI